MGTRRNYASTRRTEKSGDLITYEPYCRCDIDENNSRDVAIEHRYHVAGFTTGFVCVPDASVAKKIDAHGELITALIVAFIDIDVPMGELVIPAAEMENLARKMNTARRILAKCDVSTGGV